jgi:hypothetical protein
MAMFNRYVKLPEGIFVASLRNPKEASSLSSVTLLKASDSPAGGRVERCHCLITKIWGLGKPTL